MELIIFLSIIMLICVVKLVVNLCEDITTGWKEGAEEARKERARKEKEALEHDRMYFGEIED